MNKQKEEIAKKTESILHSVFNIFLLVITTIINVSLGILKGIYNALNKATNNIINSIFYYLFGFLFWVGLFLIIPTILSAKLSIEEGIISFILGVFILILKYKIYRETERYRNNVLQIKTKNKIDKFFIILGIIILVILIICLGIIYFSYKNI